MSVRLSYLSTAAAAYRGLAAGAQQQPYTARRWAANATSGTFTAAVGGITGLHALQPRAILNVVMSHSAVQPRQGDDGSFIAAHPAAENRYGGLHILLLLLIIFLFLTIPVEPIISTFAKFSGLV